MVKNKSKIFLIFLMFCAVGLVFSRLAIAEDDEGDDDKYKQIESESVPVSTVKVIKLPDRIITKTIMVAVQEKDQDRDGIADVEDPHPTIPEYLIIKDENQNGIDDKYDLQ